MTDDSTHRRWLLMFVLSAILVGVLTAVVFIVLDVARRMDP